MDVLMRRDLIIDWVETAAQEIKTQMSNDLEVESKSNRKDLVTKLDKATETFFRKQINHYFPGEGILGEEGMGETVENLTGPVWIIDPIDGTANFVLQHNHFAIMIAFYEDGLGQIGVIYDVMADELFVGIKGQGVTWNGHTWQPPFTDKPLDQGLLAVNGSLLMANRWQVQELIDQAMGLRIYGSAGLEFLAVAKGELLAYISPNLKPWDIAAGAVICEELGIKLSQFDGSAIDYLAANPIILAYPKSHQKIRHHYDSNK
ncbi:inositol monophosphatase family protein [Aerococcus kribbianus]|uniref:Inositol monophosphatase family protein n=1 Tax=Aerococcus kribbianus TaxID=2999064 RepID=A0A9X3FNX4_9LACT|nr:MULTISPECIES: inositol monophosphatase family protein [unclassified Aerococcus]MCZ0717233.1 inositol monophosphatase family protein [Aerococcus sp. YH-aer221]MCZ0725521.1 inositol monophosphatase family protein [Aerococcus sp. YH-aer222]